MLLEIIQKAWKNASWEEGDNFWMDIYEWMKGMKSSVWVAGLVLSIDNSFWVAEREMEHTVAFTGTWVKEVVGTYGCPFLSAPFSQQNSQCDYWVLTSED